MSDYLTTLPVELIHQILDDVPTLDILSSLSLVSKHFRSVSVAYPRFQPDFSCTMTSINKKQFDRICTQLRYLISRIVSLTLFDKDDPMTPAKNALFFSRFNCIDSTFSNLRSLSLTYINYDTWHLFKTRLPSFIATLSIHLVHPDFCRCPMMTSAILSELLFFSPSLKRLSVEMSNYYWGDTIIIRPSSPIFLSSVQYFHLKGITIDLSSLSAVVPMLHTLEIHFPDQDLITFGAIHPRLLHLQQLRIELWSIYWTEMTALLSSFPRLNYLIVIAYEVNSSMANGFAWAQLLQEVKYFECKLQFYYGAFKEQPINLDSFRTKFWLEEKKWFVTYDRNLKNDYSMLYTNSSSIDDYPSHSMIGIIVSESTGSEATSFPHVHCLTINYQYVKYALLYRYTHITKLELSRVATTFPMTFKDIITYLNTSRIITCSVSSEWIKRSPHELTKFLRSLSRLRALSVSVSVLSYLFSHQWPDILHLRIESDLEEGLQLSSSDEIDALCRSFTHLERLDIHSASVTDLPQLLNRIQNKTLTDIIIRQPRTASNEQFITREWIERNTEFQHFHYACDSENSVSLWF
jgi:hypothetical protein